MMAADETLADLDTIARGLGVGGWDLALIGDGAGRGWDKPGGWCCILVDRHAGGEPAEGVAQVDARKLFSGGMNKTTCEIAELMPYIHAMLWYERYHGKARRDELRKSVLDVLVITDRKSISSQGIALQQGRARASEICRKHPIWATIVQLERLGYCFRWMQKDRNLIALNSVADRLADTAKHAAANALAQATAHVRADLPGAPSEEELIYLFNTTAFGADGNIRPVRRRYYGKTSSSQGTGV